MAAKQKRDDGQKMAAPAKRRPADSAEMRQRPAPVGGFLNAVNLHDGILRPQRQKGVRIYRFQIVVPDFSLHRGQTSSDLRKSGKVQFDTRAVLNEPNAAFCEG
jgi:hypothetical protein